MKNNIGNLFGIILIVVLTVVTNLFSDLKLTADGIIGSNSVIKSLASFLFIFIWFLASFYSSYKNEAKVIRFFSLIYFLVFICCLIYKGIFIVFSFILSPFLPVFELLKISSRFESGDIFFVILCLLVFFAINIAAGLIGNYAKRNIRS
jgi:hypothetical protein